MNAQHPEPGAQSQADHITDQIDAYKTAFRRHPAGVAVITGRKPDGSPAGFTVTSLASLSAVPPMATFSLAKTSSSWPAIAVGNRVAIHMIPARLQPIAALMAGPAEARFEGDHWFVGPHDLPIIHGATVWLYCRIVEVHEVHHNAVVVVEIEDGELGEPGAALYYHDREYHEVP